jgi:hypothetical protein
MLKLPINNSNKTRIHLNLKLKPQTHPWDTIGEQAREKAKRIEQQRKTREDSAKHYSKNLFIFNEGSQLSEILITPQEMSSEQTDERNLQLFSEPEDSNKGFFPCPSCTCWFTKKHNLQFHIKNWCGR